MQLALALALKMEMTVLFLHKEPAWQSHPSSGVCHHPHLPLSHLWSNASMGKEKSLRIH